MDKDLIELMVNEGINVNIEFKRLHEVNTGDLLLLMNHELVRRQMPLFQGEFTRKDLKEFVVAKEQLWVNFGYGPWAFFVNDHFVGWGGLQPEEGEADLAMVLHPDHWGMGKLLYGMIIDKAFGEMGLDSVTVLFPESRTKIRGLLRLGFLEEGKVDVNGVTFIRYRLWKEGRGPISI